MKLNKRVSALALTVAVPVSMFAPTAQAAEAASAATALTVNLGAAGADSEARLLDGSGKEVDSQKADAKGVVSFDHEIAGDSEDLSIEVDGKVIEVKDAKCVISSDDASATDSTDAPTTSGSDPTAPIGTGTTETTVPTGTETTDPTGTETTSPTATTGTETTSPSSTATTATDGSTPTEGASLRSLEKLSDKLEGLSAQELSKVNVDQAQIDGLNKVIADAKANGDTVVNIDKMADATETPGAGTGGLTGLTDLLKPLIGLFTGQATDLTSIPVLGELAGVLQPIIQIVDPILGMVGGIEGVLGFVPNLPPAAIPIIKNLWESLKNGATPEEAAEQAAGENGTPTDTTDPSATDVADPNATDAEDTALPVSSDKAGFTVTIAGGTGAVDCDVDTEAVEEESTESSTTSSESTAPSSAAPAADNNVATPGPKVNTGGSVESKNFLEKIAAVFA